MEIKEHDNLRRNIRKDIFDLVRKINHTKSTTHYHILYNDILGYETLANFLNINVDDIIDKIYNINIPCNQLNMINKHYKSAKDCLEFDIKTSRNIIDIYSNSSYYEEKSFEYQERLEKKDNYRLVFDFFSEYNKNLVTKLNYLIKEERIIFVDVIDDISEGAFVCSSYKFSPYILLLPTKNIVNAATLVHELGHVWQDEQLGKRPYRNYLNCTFNNAFEVVSHVNELIFFDHLQKINFNSNDVINLKQEKLRVLLEFYDLLSEYLEQFSKKNFLDEYDDYENFYSYARGMLLAFEYRDMYLKDRELFDYNIEKFIVESGQYDFLSLINKCGLDREKIESGESIKKYVKEIF